MKGKDQDEKIKVFKYAIIFIFVGLVMILTFFGFNLIAVIIMSIYTLGILGVLAIYVKYYEVKGEEEKESVISKVESLIS